MLQNISKYNTPLISILIVLNLLDFITTYFCISMGATEANPFLAYLMELTKTVWVILYVKLILLTILVALFSIMRYYPQHIRHEFATFIAYLLVLANVVYTYVVINNMYIIDILSNLQ